MNRFGGVAFWFKRQIKTWIAFTDCNKRIHKSCDWSITVVFCYTLEISAVGYVDI